MHTIRLLPGGATIISGLCVVAAAGGGAWFSYAIEDVGLVLVLAHWCINYIARTQWSAAASANIPYSA